MDVPDVPPPAVWRVLCGHHPCEIQTWYPERCEFATWMFNEEGLAHIVRVFEPHAFAHCWVDGDKKSDPQ
jgi:hypothetical protein